MRLDTAPTILRRLRISGLIAAVMLFAVTACSEPPTVATDTKSAGAADADGGGPLVECASDVDCGDPPDTCLKAVCVSAFCTTAPRDNGAKCDDGNTCTTDEVCDDGVCVGGGECQCTTKSDCAALDDPNLCNGVLFCDLATRACVLDPSTATTCADGVSADCKVETCAPKTGLCVASAAADGAKCDDDIACTSDDTCAGGTCAGTPAAGAKACDDGNACTDDGCLGGTGCVSLPTKVTCDDGDLCTFNECIADTGCVSLPAKTTCDDDNGCTTDTCEPTKGCVNLPLQTTCTQ